MSIYFMEPMYYMESETRQNLLQNKRLNQDFITPALSQETYGDLLKWDSKPGVFMIKWTHKARSSSTGQDSRVFIAWDTLKGRPIPREHQEFVDSKQRLRAALRNLKNIVDVPSTGEYRRYLISVLCFLFLKFGEFWIQDEEFMLNNCLYQMSLASCI